MDKAGNRGRVDKAGKRGFDKRVDRNAVARPNRGRAAKTGRPVRIDTGR
jgi:hypothetical protein